MTQTHVVTGASGYTGRYITRRLLDGGAEVRSLTGHPDRPSPFERRVETYPYRFDDPDKLASSLEGADTLFNTYWIRFARGGLTHDRAVENLRTLFDAAKVAGVRRVVHISITNATEDSPSPYFRGKALAERALRESALSYAILRPTLIFGREDILLNNIAWMLRRFPVHPIAGSGEYRVQPISVDDLADIAIRLARESENVEIDAVGPEVFTYEDMVRLVRDKIGASAWLVHVSNSAAMLGARLMGLLVRDVVLTRDEIDGLTADLLVSKTGEPPPGTTRLSEWLDDNARLLGSKYASELMRHYK
jgi:NADH dehydrogenase